ncbi:MAG: site-specific DNA-methyltransferase, partial [Methanoregulaceae archaeon]|nr:site-specific DNA-methyltransferase [Methanoregulaceae archaeon]
MERYTSHGRGAGYAAPADECNDLSALPGEGALRTDSGCPDPGEDIHSRATDGKSRDIAGIGGDPCTVLCGDARTVLRSLPDDSFACCITSPPYWDTRIAGRLDRLGGEWDHRDYIATLLQVFREVRRTLSPDGTLWLVIGDTYASDGRLWWKMYDGIPPEETGTGPVIIPRGFKHKDLMGIPWRVAMELQNDGWFLRSDIVWSIPNHLTEPVRDRPTRTHDYVFLFSKSERYSYNGNGGEPASGGTVWEIPAVLDPPIYYAVFPEPLVERCMMAGSREGDVVLDPFFGSGTVGIVAKRLNRKCVGIEIDSDYAELAWKR